MEGKVLGSVSWQSITYCSTCRAFSVDGGGINESVAWLFPGVTEVRIGASGAS